MKQVGFAILGLLLALVCLTFFAPLNTATLYAAYGGILYSLFFAKADSSTPFLIGFTMGIELLGTHHFGAASLLGVLLYGLYVLFGLRLRFTSPYSRFIVALLLGLLATSFLLYPFTGWASRLLSAFVAALLVSASGALLQRSSEPSAYELL